MSSRLSHQKLNTQIWKPFLKGGTNLSKPRHNGTVDEGGGQGVKVTKRKLLLPNKMRTLSQTKEHQLITTLGGHGGSKTRGVNR